MVSEARLEHRDGERGLAGSLGQDGILDVREFEAAKYAAGFEYSVYVRAKESG